MNKILLLLLVASCRFYCQSTEEFIRRTAIDYQDPTSVNQKIYTVLKDHKCICIGEMHGTKEPAQLLTGLVKTFLANNRRVIVGMEIPDKSMTEFHKQHDSSGLSKTNFFSDKTVDGRGSEAWFRAIMACNQPGVTFCFFDNADENRDKGMYELLLTCYETDTNTVVITLTGNIHNLLVPHNNTNTMGCFLKAHFGNRLCTINHIYNGGTMYSKTSEGLGIHTIAPGNSVFATSTAYQNYYIPNIFTSVEYSGFFYTSKMNASLPKTK